MSVTARPSIGRVLSVFVVTALGLSLLAAWVEDTPVATATSVPTDGATLTIVDQNFAVAPGAPLSIKLVAAGTAVDPVAAALTTTTTTTTTLPTTIFPSGSDTAAGSGSTPGEQTPAEQAGSEALKNLSIRLEVREPVTNSKAVQSALDGDVGDVIDRTEHPLADVATLGPDGASGGVQINLDEPIFDPLSGTPAPKNSLDKLDPGVYPVSVQLLKGKAVVAETTTLFERVGTESLDRGPVSVGLLMRIPSSPNADVAAELTDLADLAETTDVPLSVALEPNAVLAALNARSDLAARLSAAITTSDVLLSGPQLPLDPSAAAAAGLESLYADWTTGGIDALRQAFPSAMISNQATIIDSHLTTAGGTLLADSGNQLFITDASSYTRFRGSVGSLLDTSLLSRVRLEDQSTNPLAVVEPNISALLSLAGAEGGQAPDELRLIVAITADLAVVRYGSNPDVRSVLLATSTYAPPSAAFVGRMLPFAQHAVTLTPQPVTLLPAVTNTQFTDGKPVTARLGTKPVIDLSTRAEANHSARLIVADAASMMPTDDPNVQRWSNELDEVYRTDWTDRQAAEVTDRVSSEADEIRQSVLTPEPFPLIITGRTADLPIEIKSRASVPLTVRLHPVSDELIFPRGDQSVTLAPNETTSVIIPVEARTNGVLRLTLQLMTPAGNELTDAVPITARFTAISGMGKLITGAFVLILLTWWLSYYRRHRANRRVKQLEGAQRHPAYRQARSSAVVDDAPVSSSTAPRNDD